MVSKSVTIYYISREHNCPPNKGVCLCTCTVYTHVLWASWADAWASDVLEIPATQLESDASSNKLTPVEQMRHAQHVETS